MPLRRLLALESGGTSCSVALLDGHGGLSFQSADSGQSHSSQLLPMAEALLSDAGMTIADVDGVVVGIGPGSFTGLRIAVGVAQGLALGKACPVLGVSGFELWAYIWWQSRPERFRGEHGRFAELSISFDARLGERFVAQLRVQQTSDQLVLESRLSPCVCMADDPRCAAPIALVDPTPAGRRLDDSLCQRPGLCASPCVDRCPEPAAVVREGQGRSDHFGAIDGP